MRTLARFCDALRLRRWLLHLQRPVEPRDRMSLVLFLVAFLSYALIGQLIVEVNGFNEYNYFFNADCPRVLGDMARSQRQGTSSPEASVAHPFFVLLTNIPTAVLSRALSRSEQAAALLFCHAAAALAVVLFYRILRQLRIERWLSACAAWCYMVSASQLICGSILETYPFASAAIMFGIWWALRSKSAWQNAAVQVLGFGVHVVLAAHSLLAAPVIWWTQMRFGRWLARTLAFWMLLGAAVACGFTLRRALYPDSVRTAKDQYSRFMTYAHVPKELQHLKPVISRVMSHVVLFNVIAPTPKYSGTPARMTTFMWYSPNEFPKYTIPGRVATGSWGILFAGAAWINLRQLRNESGATRGLLLLCLGWLVAVSAVFMSYGDDYLLYSALWNGHVLLWVWVGVASWLARRQTWLGRIVILAFLIVLTFNNAQMVYRIVRNYNPGQLLTW